MVLHVQSCKNTKKEVKMNNAEIAVDILRNSSDPRAKEVLPFVEFGMNKRQPFLPQLVNPGEVTKCSCGSPIFQLQAFCMRCGQALSFKNKQIYITK